MRNEHYRDIRVDVVLLAVFSNKTARQFVDTGRNNLESFMGLGEHGLEGSYFQFQVVETSHLVDFR